MKGTDMYIILKDDTGRATEGVLLAAGRDVVRITVRGESDTLELRRSDAGWTAGGDERFEIDAVVANTDASMSRLGSILRAQTMAAGMQVLD